MAEPAKTQMEQNLPPQGDGSETPPPAETPKAFTQDEVNSLLKKNKLQLQEQLKKEQEARSALEKKMESILAKFEVAEQNDPKAKTEEGRLEAAQKRFERQVAELEAKVKEQENKAQQELHRRLDGERDRLLDEALVQSGCIDIKAGRRYFLPDITREDEDGQPADTWLLKTGSGKLIDIATGVMESLPKYLRNPSVNVGGSGTSSGGPKAKEKDAIKKVENELEVLKTKAREAGPRNGPFLIAYEAKKRELNALKRATGK